MQVNQLAVIFTVLLAAIFVDGPEARADGAQRAPWAVQLHGGASRLKDHLAGYPNQDRPPFDMAYGDAGVYGAAVARDLTAHWSVEIEWSRRIFDLASSSPEGSSVAGTFASEVLMANLVWSQPGPTVYPLLGVGVGNAAFRMDGIRVNNSLAIDDRARAIAYQLMAGAGFAISRNFSLTFEYRLLLTSKPLFEDAAGDLLEPSYVTHNVLVGLRAGFGG